MAEVVRTFKIPEHLSDESVSQLTSNLRALPDRQKKLAQSAPAIAVAREVVIQGGSIKIYYECEQPDTAADAITGQGADAETLLDWAGQLCEAFMSAYPTGESPTLRHGGLCPAAVVVTAGGSLGILDFGVAECFAAVPDAADESWLMQVAGSVAPEVWNAPGKFGEQSDVFAVGVMLYELATGKHPFGAIRDDPEDCKYQILVELPVPPNRRNRALSEPLSQFIYRAVRSQPEKRYAGFAEMLEALTSCRKQLADDTRPSGEPRALAGADDVSQAASAQSVDPRGLKTHGSSHHELPATAPEEEDEEQQRREYLLEQAALKQEREQAKRRQDQRQQRTRQTRAKIRRHALALTISLLVLVVVSGSALVMVRRSQNTARVEDFLDRTNRKLAKEFSVGRTDEVAALLGIATPSAGLSRALADLRKVAPDSPPVLKVDEFTNLMRSAGHGLLVIGDHQLDVRLQSKANDTAAAVNVELTDANLERFVAGLVDRLAGAQLDAAARNFIDRLRNIVMASHSVFEVEQALAKLLAPTLDSPRPAASQVLGYLGYQGKAKTLSLGRFEPVPGESAVRSAAIVMGDDGRAVENFDPQITFELDCATEGSPCQLVRITVQPAEEPAAHRQWCIESVMQAMSRTFGRRDVAALAALTNQSQLDPLDKTIAWAKQCKSADLVFEEVDYESAVALARVKYQPGLLAGSMEQHTTPAMQIGFSVAHGWGVRPSLQIDWPRRPTILLRQQLGAELLAKLSQAWRQQDPQAYLALFEGCTRSAESVAGMFQKMMLGHVEVEFRATEDQDSEIVLLIEATTNHAELYAPKRFGFVLEQDKLRWDPSSDDPLWTVAGDRFREFVERLRNTDWEQISSIEADIQDTPQGDLSPQERQELRQWLAAIQAAKDLFEPRSADFSNGFARQTVLKGTSEVSMPFHVVFIPGAGSNVVYMLEREVRVADVAAHWSSSDRPWKQWEAIVGLPPADQLVGITLADARKLAADMGCELPTLSEWRSAAGGIPAAAEMGFGGGVWEFVDDATDDGVPLIVGGCWYDGDGMSADSSARQPAPIRRQSRFGTIGFRMCKRFAIPEQALLKPPSAAGS